MRGQYVARVLEEEKTGARVRPRRCRRWKIGFGDVVLYGPFAYLSRSAAFSETGENSCHGLRRQTNRIERSR